MIKARLSIAYEIHIPKLVSVHYNQHTINPTCNVKDNRENTWSANTPHHNVNQKKNFPKIKPKIRHE